MLSFAKPYYVFKLTVDQLPDSFHSGFLVQVKLLNLYRDWHELVKKVSSRTHVHLGRDLTARSFMF